MNKLVDKIFGMRNVVPHTMERVYEMSPGYRRTEVRLTLEEYDLLMLIDPRTKYMQYENEGTWSCFVCSHEAPDFDEFDMTLETVPFYFCPNCGRRVTEWSQEELSSWYAMYGNYDNIDDLIEALCDELPSYLTLSSYALDEIKDMENGDELDYDFLGTIKRTVGETLEVNIYEKSV